MNESEHFISHVCRKGHMAKFIILIYVAVLYRFGDTRRISEIKCEEYADYVNSDEVSPVLRMGMEINKVSQCGIVETPLIIGGVRAQEKEFPHMVAIGFGNSDEVFWSCGGSLISEDFVLTASHCIESADKGPATLVRAGTTTLEPPGPDSQERLIAERYRHPDYAPPSHYHDIALLKLDEPFDLNGAVRPACLEQLPRPPERSAIACGFGKTAFDNEEGSNELMKVQLNYISEDVCKNSYKLDIGTRQLPSGLIANMLCAGIMEGDKDTCQGDSGGPLQRVLSEPYCMYSIVGVTSFGKFCAFANSPAIYSRVSSYLDWIESIVWPEV